MGQTSGGAGGLPLSYHAMGSSHDPGASPGQDAARSDRQDAITELGEALRTLVERSAATEVPADVLRRAAERVLEIAGPLAARQRGRLDLPSADDLLGGVRLYNPVCGTGSAIAPPLRIDVVDGTVVGSCTLGLAFEGPPGHAHGGVSALLLDQLLGYAVSAAGLAGMTVELVTRYRAPVPLQTPLHLAARVVKTEGRTVTAHGWISVAEAPEIPLAEATGTFVHLTADQARRIFPRLQPAPDPSEGAGQGVRTSGAVP